MDSCAEIIAVLKEEFETMKKCILQTSVVAWDQKVTRTLLQHWLDNFSGEHLNDIQAEQAIAAWLLMNFTYYSEKEVQELCRVLFRKYIHQKLNETPYRTLNTSTSEKIRHILEHTSFRGLGNPSESGGLILYIFRQANGLSKDLFDELVRRENVVLIDDVTISGEQAIRYMKQLPSETSSVLATLFAAPDAISRIEKEAPKLSTLFAIALDNRSKLFDKDSFAFSSYQNPDFIKVVREMCLYYGEKIISDKLTNAAPYMIHHPLGFDDGQQMFAFYYNTPDNTIPLFWCNAENWRSLFPRYFKIDRVGEVKISDEKYW
ncbi:MAG: phosphoribosyltransferase-like protein [Saccharofermentanales bacterium]|jgi:hypothetical protein